MRPSKTAKRVRRFIEDALLDPGIAIESDPLAEGLLDSLAIEQVIAYAEETFDIVFDDDELVAENFATVDVLAQLIDRKLAGG